MFSSGDTGSVFTVVGDGACWTSTILQSGSDDDVDDSNESNSGSLVGPYSIGIPGLFSTIVYDGNICSGDLTGVGGDSTSGVAGASWADDGAPIGEAGVFGTDDDIIGTGNDITGTGDGATGTGDDTTGTGGGTTGAGDDATAGATGDDPRRPITGKRFRDDNFGHPFPELG